MNEITLFENVSFGSIRTVQIDGEIWFVAKDILIALGYAENSNPAKVMQAIPDEWKGVKQIHTPGGVQKVLILKEQGLYFFLGRSDKPKALPFQKWVAGDVIVSIRKTGSYGAFADMLPKNFPEALRALAKSEEEKEVLKIERDKAIRAKGQISSSREAKALNMLSQQSKTIRKLEDKLGIGETYKTTKAIPWISEVFQISKGMYSQVGKVLTKISNKMGFPVRKIETPDYPGGVNAYHVDVVSELYDELFRNPALLSKYRVY